MHDALSEELGHKLDAVSRLLGIAGTQNTHMKNGSFGEAAILEAEKKPLLDRLSELDNSAKAFIIKNKKYPLEVQETVKRINFLLNKLIDLERENNRLATEKEIADQGRHIEAYRKNIK